MLAGWTWDPVVRGGGCGVWMIVENVENKAVQFHGNPLAEAAQLRMTSSHVEECITASHCITALLLFRLSTSDNRKHSARRT